MGKNQDGHSSLVTYRCQALAQVLDVFYLIPSAQLGHSYYKLQGTDEGSDTGVKTLSQVTQLRSGLQVQIDLSPEPVS